MSTATKESAAEKTPRAGSGSVHEVDGQGTAPSPEGLLQQARTAQKARRWLQAADAYKGVLDLNPQQADIWVQFGHMLKEGGKRDEAGSAYQKALDLQPENADTYLQFGHLYKITNRKYQAIRMYARALELDPQLRDAAEELERLGAGSRAEAIKRRSAREGLGNPTFYFDITDLLMFFHDSRTPTGIQRLALAIIEAALQSEEANNIGLCALDEARRTWRAISSDQLLTLALLSHDGAKDSDPAWKSAVGDILDSAASGPALVFPRHSVVVSLGSPWGVANYFMAIRDAKRRSAIRFVAYVHDTIPLLLPELCDGTTADIYTRWAAGLTLHADLLFVNAENTRRDLLLALRNFGSRPPACKVVQPNGDFSLFFQGTDAVSDEVQAVVDSKFALFVGTIEPRKNHIFVLAAWRKLVQELGAKAVPKLVLAGKLGWHCDAVVEFLRRTDSLGGKVKVLHEVSDVDLQALYRHAMFTVYNSQYEGWGLPVTESLSFQKVPVIPRNSSLVESGGRHAIFYESNSEPSFIQTIRNVVENPDLLEDRVREIQSNCPVRPWDEIFRQVFEAVKQLPTQSHDTGAERLVLECGKIYSVATDKSMQHPRDFALAEAARIGSGWHHVEEWGVWTSRPNFELSWNVGSPKSQQAEKLQEAKVRSLYLHIRSPGRTKIRLEINGISEQTFLLPDNRDVILRVEIGSELLEAGQLRVLGYQSTIFELSESTKGKDPRSVGIGLRAFMLCDDDDTIARIRLLEEISMGYLLPLADSAAADASQITSSAALVDAVRGA